MPLHGRSGLSRTVFSVIGSLKLLKACLAAKISKFIFSSSAAVYGEPAESPITEDFPLNPCSPYGQNKLELENALKAEAEEKRLREKEVRERETRRQLLEERTSQTKKQKKRNDRHCRAQLK